MLFLWKNLCVQNIFCTFAPKFVVCARTQYMSTRIYEGDSNENREQNTTFERDHHGTMFREGPNIEHFKKEEIWTKKWLHFLQQLEMESAKVLKVQDIIRLSFS